MGQDFQVGLSAGVANRLGTVTAKLPGGVVWSPALRNPDDLKAWWQDRANKIIAELPPLAKPTTDLKTAIDNVGTALNLAFGTGPLPTGVSRSDVLDETISRLVEHETALAAALAHIPATAAAKLDADVRSVRDVSHSVGLAVTALGESGAPATSEEFRNGFAELSLRDVSESLHDTVGDPPAAAMWGTQDKPADFGATAVQGLPFAPPPSGWDDWRPTPQSIGEDLVGDLKAATSTTADPAERAGSVFRLAMHLQDLHRDLSVSAAYAARGENVAGQDQRLRDTIAVAMVVGEATRGVLGLAPRREGALDAAAADTVGKAVTDQSTERIIEVKKAVKEKRDEHEL